MFSRTFHVCQKDFPQAQPHPAQARVAAPGHQAPHHLGPRELPPIQGGQTHAVGYQGGFQYRARYSQPGQVAHQPRRPQPQHHYHSGDNYQAHHPQQHQPPQSVRATGLAEPHVPPPIQYNHYYQSPPVPVHEYNNRVPPPTSQQVTHVRPFSLQCGSPSSTSSRSSRCPCSPAGS